MTDALAKVLTLQEAMELAKVFADSDLVPKEYKGKPANCVIAIKMGEEVGLSPFQALQSVCVINGKPSLYGDAGLGVVMASGELVDMKEEDDGETATCTMNRKGYPNPVTRSFSAADAARIKMYETDKQGVGEWKPLANRVTWRNHPKRMRQWRARWWTMRDLFPDKLKGLRGVEEMEEATIIDVTPTPGGPELFPELEPREVMAVEPDVIPSAGVHPPTQEATPAMSVPDPACEFELNGVQYQTKGITRDQLLVMFDLGPKANKRQNDKQYDKKMLASEFGVMTRKDLTAEAAEQYIIRLREVVEAE